MPGDPTGPDGDPRPVLSYRSDVADARPAVVTSPSVVGGCMTTVGCVFTLVAATAYVGLHAFEELVVPAGLLTAIALGGVGLRRGLRDRDWGYLIGVGLAAAGVAGFVTLVRLVAFQ